MTLHFSASLGGFLHADIHPSLPSDAVPVAADQHADLMAGQAEGRRIVADAKGCPCLEGVASPSIEARRQAALHTLRGETRRRILAIASLERQSNDNAEIALQALQLAQAGHTTIDTAAALERRTRIDQVRAASDQLAVAIAGMNVRTLAQLDVAAPSHWPN